MSQDQIGQNEARTNEAKQSEAQPHEKPLKYDGQSRRVRNCPFPEVSLSAKYASPEGHNVIVFDCEIKNEIDGKNIGWRDFGRMGHAVSSLYDYRSGDYCIYFDDNLDRMVERINEADLVVGFNIVEFDLPLIAVSAKAQLRPDIAMNCYDMLPVTRRSTGWRAGRFPSGMKLDDHLLAMYGTAGMKSGHGANAPNLWQEKKLGELCSYVLRDVNREKALFESAWYAGQFATPTHGIKEVERPQMMLHSLLMKRSRAF